MGPWFLGYILGTCSIPQHLTATAAGLQINLAWEAVAGITTYRIERSADGVTWAPLDVVSATSYMDPPTDFLKANETWHYRVSSYLAATDSYSEPGNTAAATTSA